MDRLRFAREGLIPEVQIRVGEMVDQMTSVGSVQEARWNGFTIRAAWRDVRAIQRAYIEAGLNDGTYSLENGWLT